MRLRARILWRTPDAASVEITASDIEGSNHVIFCDFFWIRAANNYEWSTVDDRGGGFCDYTGMGYIHPRQTVTLVLAMKGGTGYHYDEPTPAVPPASGPVSVIWWPDKFSEVVVPQEGGTS